MKAVEILPRLWIGNNSSIAEDIDFFKTKNIRYVVNLTHDIDNYFKNVTYLNISLNQTIDETKMKVSMTQLFDVVNQFITNGYFHNVGILIHDISGKLSIMFACAFIMQKLNLPYSEALNYLSYYTNHNFNYIVDNPFLIKFNNYLIAY